MDLSEETKMNTRAHPDQKVSDENSSSHPVSETIRTEVLNSTTDRTVKEPILTHATSPPNDDPLSRRDIFWIQKLLKQRGVEDAINCLFGSDSPSWTPHKLLACSR